MVRVCHRSTAAADDALRSGDGLRQEAPGEPFTAAFAVDVIDRHQTAPEGHGGTEGV